VLGLCVQANLIMLGGAEEIGANCCYVELDGTGVLIDAGLHPRDRTVSAFPNIDLLENYPADILAITHAHTDHIGALPYVMRRLPYLRPIMTPATRDLSHIVMHNGAKLLRTEVGRLFPAQWLEFFDKEVVEQLRFAFEALPYEEPLTIRGYSGRSNVTMTYHWSGHILGSSSVSLECNGLRILHTADVKFDDQVVLPKARLPRHHVDVLITECTNAASDHTPTFPEEAKRLAAFINSISQNNGSVLSPTFAMGKLQEMIPRLYGLMRRGSIPHMPIYTGGMGVRISKVYDQYCYSDPMRRPGFEVSDIPQERLRRGELDTGGYFKHPSIVLAPSGMMNVGTMSHQLALKWIGLPTYGIAFVGYQDETSPGHALMMSEHKKPFDFGTKSVSRSCQIERFRLSGHASREDLVALAVDTTPSTVVITHGDTLACERLALEIHELLPAARVIIPRAGAVYTVGRENP
jgi:Cft2 family RNA processing exonuclease